MRGSTLPKYVSQIMLNSIHLTRRNNMKYQDELAHLSSFRAQQ